MCLEKEAAHITETPNRVITNEDGRGISPGSTIGEISYPSKIYISTTKMRGE
jgi:hypothetical protein